MRPQKRPSASPSTSSEGRLEKTRWTENKELKENTFTPVLCFYMSESHISSLIEWRLPHHSAEWKYEMLVSCSSAFLFWVAHFIYIHLVWFCICHFPTATYPINTVGVADSRDGFAFRVGRWWRVERRQAAIAAAQAVVSTPVLFIWRTSRWNIEARPLHSIMDPSGKFLISTLVTFHHRDTEWSAVFTVSRRRRKNKMLCSEMKQRFNFNVESCAHCSTRRTYDPKTRVLNHNIRRPPCFIDLTLVPWVRFQQNSEARRSWELR